MRRQVVLELRLFLVALQFLSRVPIPHWVGYEPSWLNRCVRHFPLVGALVGGAGAAVLAAAHAFWPPWIAAALAVGATVWLTVAFHEDGLADTFDALLGATRRDRALQIMKDSRIGSYGSVALSLVLLLRVALLAELLQRHGLPVAALALIASHALARAAAVLLMVSLPYAGDEAHAKAKPLARGVPPRDAVVAGAWCATLACTPLPAWPLGAALAALLGLVLAMRAWLLRRLGGYTGDTLGATEQLGEVVALLALVTR